jgi:hypothetical protein
MYFQIRSEVHPIEINLYSIVKLNKYKTILRRQIDLIQSQFLNFLSNKKRKLKCTGYQIFILTATKFNCLNSSNQKCLEEILKKNFWK